MSIRCHLIAATLLVGLMTFQLFAQLPGGRRGGIRSPLDLDLAFVGYRSIRNELGLTEAQLELLNALDRDLAAQSRSFRRRRPRQGQTNQVEISRKIFSALLEPEQVKRLAEINRQFRGLYVIDDEQFVEEVSLSEEQLAAVRAKRKENQNFDMTKLNEVVGLEKAKEWWTTLGYPFVFSEELRDLRDRYRVTQQAGLSRRRRP